MRGGIWASVFVCAGTALWSACIAEAATKAKPQISAETLKHAIEGKTGSVQLITFPATAWSAVRIVRGGLPARDKSGQKPVADKAETAEIVTFADPRRSPVRVLRGDSERALATPGQVRPAPGATCADRPRGSIRRRRRRTRPDRDRLRKPGRTTPFRWWPEVPRPAEC